MFTEKTILMNMLLLLSAAFISALEVERYAIFAGCNNAGKDHEKLMYAATDAMAFQKTMSEIGGVSKANGILLLEPGKDDLDQAMDDISHKILNNKNKASRTEFIFYYSGHSDEDSLLLGKETYSYSQLKAAISSVPSDVHVVILDSCYSGNFIRTKGGQRQKPFLVDDSSVVKGHAYLSSSSSQEFSQESDEIGSSFFTSAMLTGLRGAADSSGDKRVTLNELYSYAFNETLYKTEKSSAGPQHPNYNITLVGSGDLVLSDISSSDCVVRIASDVKGRVIIRNTEGKLISEINKLQSSPVYLALEEDTYNVVVISDSNTKQGKFTLTSGKVYDLKSSNLNSTNLEVTRLRGGDSSSDGGEDSDDEDEEDKEVDLAWMPLDFSFVMNEFSSLLHKDIYTNCSVGLFNTSAYEVKGVMTSAGISSAEIIKGVQLSALISYAKEVHGIQGAEIFNAAHDIHGIQAAGIFNSAHDIHGIQASGVFNFSHDVNGIQASGIFNNSRNFSGLQTAGIFNKADDFQGLQTAGIFNTSDDFSGLQAAGIVNNAGALNGFQASGVLNFADSITGLQAAGVLNVTDYLSQNGVQIGLINYAKESDGFQLGLLNISRNGLLEYELALTSNLNLRHSITSGNSNLYCVLGYSTPVVWYASPWIEEDEYYGVYFGIGSRYSIGKFDFDFEVAGNQVFFGKKLDPEDSDSDNGYYPSLRLAAGYKPVDKVKIVTGFILSAAFNDDKLALEEMDSNILIKRKNAVFLPEFELGLSYSFN
ncbi:caspase family protein [Treponema sp.]|uniref:caspase family protein n=1 Tax=Treponema sp. TaxID=166 RepID=UPI0025D5BB0C|nr:caspase family protein [Treponema sp.]MCR5217088.1 caspase family protein [Treponema sp.]